MENTVTQWHVESDTLIRDEQGRNIASVGIISFRKDSEWQANAKLIAASPANYKLLVSQYEYISKLPFKTAREMEFLSDFEQINGLQA